MATRRSLAGGAVLALLGAAGASAAPMLGEGADAELIRLCGEFRESEAAFCVLYDYAASDDDEAAEDARDTLATPIMDSWASMLDRMAALRAVTVEGVAARAFALAQHSGIKPGTDHYAFAFEPDGETVSGRLLHYLLRDALAVKREVGEELRLPGAHS